MAATNETYTEYRVRRINEGDLTDITWMGPGRSRSVMEQRAREARKDFAKIPNVVFVVDQREVTHTTTAWEPIP